MLYPRWGILRRRHPFDDRVGVRRTKLQPYMAAVFLDYVHEVVLEIGEYLIPTQDAYAAERYGSVRHVDAQRRRPRRPGHPTL